MAIANLTRFIFTLAAAWAALMWPVQAHEIRPAVVTATLNPSGDYHITVALNIEALLAGIGPEHRDTNDAPESVTYNELRKLASDELRAKFATTAPRWLEGVRLEFGGMRVAPRIASR
jgi:hypothetical protein